MPALPATILMSAGKDIKKNALCCPACDGDSYTVGFGNAYTKVGLGSTCWLCQQRPFLIYVFIFNAPMHGNDYCDFRCPFSHFSTNQLLAKFMQPLLTLDKSSYLFGFLENFSWL